MKKDLENKIEVNSTEATSNNTENKKNNFVASIEAAHKKSMKNKKDKRNLKFKRASFVTGALVLLLAIVINLMADSLLKDRFRFDFTSNKLMTLSEETTNLLLDLKHEIEIIALSKEDSFLQNTSVSFVSELLKEYQNKSNGKLSIKYIDPVSDPQIIKTLDPDNVKNIKQSDIAVYSPETKKVKILDPATFINQQMDQRTYQAYISGYSAEAGISGAVQFVDSEESLKVYFSQGHKEDDRNEKYKILAQLLDNNNFLMEDLPSKQIDEIPEDANILFMLNPKADISEKESKNLEAYIKRGGSLFVVADFSDSDYVNLNSVLKEFNIAISNDRVLENNNALRLAGDQYSFLADEPQSPLNQAALTSSTLVSYSRKIGDALNGKEWIKLSTLLQSSADASIEEKGQSEKASEKGVQTIGLASENSGFIGAKNSNGETVNQSSRAIVFGSSLMFSDTVLINFMQQTNNLSLLNSSLLWLGRSETQSMMIRPVTPVSYAISASNYSLVPYISIILIAVLPLIFVVLAVFVYRKRKNL